MTFKSAQTHFEGQQGWNDLAPDALQLAALARKSKSKPRARRVVTPLPTETFSQPSQTSLPPPTKTSSASAPPPVAPPPVAPPRALPSETLRSKTRPPAETDAPSSSEGTSLEEVSGALIDLTRARDLDIETQQKIRKLLPELSQPHLDFLKRVLDTAKLPQGEVRAREMLVDYGLLHANVTVWTVPVRQLLSGIA